jgi:hypothetical protein
MKNEEWSLVVEVVALDARMIVTGTRYYRTSSGNQVGSTTDTTAKPCGGAPL